MDDFDLARRLQDEEFSKKHDKLSPSQASRIRKNKENEPSAVPSSLIDPNWELIDPNPNIHSLFLAFDQKYFWGALESVEVKWSPRMTSCAGICTYKGKRGGCAISLSLPLLKLRPRKDLVETLLHEMIHAYLFLTSNDRDRDGHGPQFHFHMYRINAEAGTKISVYHSFHDEVRHYKTHWWRCDGPCRLRRPFYGIVKRAMNRAPGPNDFWFGEHQSTCGGTYIKIQEPDGFKSRKRNTSNNKSPDIRNYLIKTPPKSSAAGQLGDLQKSLPAVPKGNTYNNIGSIPRPPVPKQNPKVNLFDPSPKPTALHGSNPSNVHGFRKSASNQTSKVNGTANIHGFGSSSGGSFSGGLKSNKGGTLIQNSKVIEKDKPDNSTKSQTEKLVVPFSGTGHVLAAPGSVVDRSQSRLLALYQHQAKKPKLDIIDVRKDLKACSIESPPKKQVPCPSCSEPVDVAEVNEHLDICLKMDFEDQIDDKNLPPSPSKSLFANCPICGRSFYKTKVNEHVTDCLNNDPFVDLTEDPVDTGAPSTSSSSPLPAATSPSKALFANCPVCDKKVFKTKMDEHLDACVRLDSIMDSSGYEIVEIDKGESSLVQCPCCDHTFTQDAINGHLDSCLQSLDFQ